MGLRLEVWRVHLSMKKVKKWFRKGEHRSTGEYTCERRLFHPECEKVWKSGGRDGHGEMGVSRQGSQWGRKKDRKGRGKPGHSAHHQIFPIFKYSIRHVYLNLRWGSWGYDNSRITPISNMFDMDKKNTLPSFSTDARGTECCCRILIGGF